MFKKALCVVLVLMLCALTAACAGINKAPLPTASLDDIDNDSGNDDSGGYEDDDFMSTPTPINTQLQTTPPAQSTMPPEPPIVTVAPPPTPQETVAPLANSPQAPVTTHTAQTPAATVSATATIQPTATVSPTATPAQANTIILNESSITAGSGVTVNGSSAVINAAGTYEISGSLTDGSISVNISKTERAYLILKGVNIACKSGAPLNIISCDKTVITLTENTINTFTDSKQYTTLNSEGEPNACIFAKDDLTIKGSGKLIVNASYNNGIGSKDDIKITGGVISVTAVNHSIRGNDSVSIAGGTITLKAGKDAIKSTTADDSSKGYILIEGGSIMIDAKDDGIQAVTSVTISGGTVKITADGKKINCDVQSITAGCLT